jgi:hypothetical protein
MNSNDHPSAYGYQPHGDHKPKRPWQPLNETTLHSGVVGIERKSFMLLLKENPRGRFLRITEHGGVRPAAIIVPATGLNEFRKLLDEMMAAEAAAAVRTPPANRI